MPVSRSATMFVVLTWLGLAVSGIGASASAVKEPEAPKGLTIGVAEARVGETHAVYQVAFGDNRGGEHSAYARHHAKDGCCEECDEEHEAHDHGHKAEGHAEHHGEARHHAKDRGRE